ncbi:MFS polyamine transporter [Amanita rubescens]|nr:MFS polyamine transporter [Amanita rubescens]
METEPRSISPKSSITFVHSRPVSSHRPNNESNDAELEVNPPVYEEAEWIEHEIEQYGGDEPQDPPVKIPSKTSHPATDPNLVGWDGPNDLDNPQNWSVRYKWFMTIVVIVMTVNVTFASSAPAEATLGVIQEFNITAEVSYLVTAVFLIGYIFGPFFWGPGSELIGRRPIFIVTMTLYTLFILGQALAKNIPTLLVTRFFSGFFGVAPLINAGGVIADIFPADGRGLATSLFTAGVFLGPVMGPIVSGYIVVSGVSWRWVYWVMMMFAGACTIITALFLPETYAPILLLQRAKRLRKADPVNANLYAEHERQDWSLFGVLKRTLFRPFQMLALEPILLLMTIYTSIVYGLLYALFEAFPIIFMVRRNFNAGQGGLIFIGVGIGTTIGSLVNAFLSRNYKELIKQWKGFPPPENRLTSAMVGAPLLVVSIFWLGWTGEYASVPWYVPALSTIPLGAGISLIFMSVLSYFVDTYLMYSASAFAANAIVRCAAAAGFSLFTVQMFTNLGIHWACTVIGIIAALFIPCPFLFYKYGARLRQKSSFAPSIDLKIAKELEAEERKINEKNAEV